MLKIQKEVIKKEIIDVSLSDFELDIILNGLEYYKKGRQLLGAVINEHIKIVQEKINLLKN